MGKTGTEREADSQYRHGSSKREGPSGKSTGESSLQERRSPPSCNGEHKAKRVVPEDATRKSSEGSSEKFGHRAGSDRRDSGEGGLARNRLSQEETGRRMKHDDMEDVPSSRDPKRGQRGRTDGSGRTRSDSSPSRSPDDQDGEDGATAAPSEESCKDGTADKLPGGGAVSGHTSDRPSPVPTSHRALSPSASPSCEKPQDNSAEAEASGAARFHASASPSLTSPSSPSSPTPYGSTRGATSALPRRAPPSTVLDTGSRTGGEAHVRTAHRSSAGREYDDSRSSPGANAGSNKREREPVGGRGGEAGGGSGRESSEKAPKSSRTEKRDEFGRAEEKDKDERGSLATR